MGESKSDRTGAAVGGGCDVNGDHIPDVVIGAPLEDHGLVDSGSVYVVYGRQRPGTIQLRALGNRGFRIDGVRRRGHTGAAVALIRTRKRSPPCLVLVENGPSSRGPDTRSRRARPARWTRLGRSAAGTSSSPACAGQPASSWAPSGQEPPAPATSTETGARTWSSATPPRAGCLCCSRRASPARARRHDRDGEERSGTSAVTGHHHTARSIANCSNAPCETAARLHAAWPSCRIGPWRSVGRVADHGSERLVRQEAAARLGRAPDVHLMAGPASASSA